MRRKLPLWLLLAAFSVDVHAQVQQSIAARGEEVMVDAIVRDKKGRAVTDLTQADFQVFDNGEQRPIKSFRLVQGREALNASGTVTKLDPLRQVRLVTLIFDRLDLNGRRLARTAALDLLKTNLPQNVYMGVYSLDLKLDALQPFTNDLTLLRKAVERATSGAYTEFGGESAAIQRHLEEAVGPNTYGSLSMEGQVDNMTVATGPHGETDPTSAFAQMAASIMLQSLRFDQRTDLAETGRASISGLLAAIQGQYQLPGRKSILYFSEGFSIPQGMEQVFQAIISTANKFNVSFYDIDAHGLATNNLNDEANRQLAAAATASADNGKLTPVGDNHVTVASALSVDTALDAGKYNKQDTLAILAEATGGFLIANTNDFRGPLQKVAEEIETYYEINYSPNIEKYDGAFRKISVKTTRSDLRVQSRSGYFALPPSLTKGATGLSSYEIPLLSALAGAQPKDALTFESGGLHFRGEGHLQTCGFVIEMPFKNVTVEENKQTGTFDGGLSYVVLIKDASGEVVKKMQGDYPLNLKGDQVYAFRQSQFTDMEYFDLPAGRYTIETALVDRQTSKTSTRKSVLIVPPGSSSLGMSSVSLIRKWRPKEPDAAEDDPFVVGDKTVTPTLTPTVKKSNSTALPFYVVIYPDQSNSAPPRMMMEFDRDGKRQRVEAPPVGQADSQGRIQYVATAPIEKLDPGNYEVRFIVTQGNEMAQETFPLMLEP
jgi:VWFA-related protein